MDELLSGLKQQDSKLKLPLSCKTLLRTERSTNIIEMTDGSYCHIPIERCLNAVLLAFKKEEKTIPEEMILDFNIDGVQYSKSTKKSLWLIQMSLRGLNSDPFVIGIFCGEKKPKCNEFLNPFVGDLNLIIEDGFFYGDKRIPVRSGRFICDTPAISFIRGNKGHAGYHSCIKCTQKGLKLDHKLVFPHITKSDRTDASFRSREDPQHHVYDSILENIESIDMVKDFVIDEMHIVHLGVVRKLVIFWLSELQADQKAQIKARLSVAEKFRPIEIRRQIRDLDQVNLFKAKEFRTLLFYTSPYVLKDVLDKQKYDHLLLLHFAMRKLCDKRFLTDIESIQALIEKFVKKYKELYGLANVTYVVHILLHLCNDVKLNGCCPQEFSAYTYENNNNKIVKNIRHGHNVCQQIHHRAIEKLNVFSIEPDSTSLPVLKDKSMNDGKIQFRQVIFKGLRFDVSEKNRWFVSANNEICCFEFAEIVNEKVNVVCQRISQPYENFFNSPFDSSEIGIYFVRDEDCEKLNHRIDINLISSKIFAIPTTDGMAFFPLIND